MTVESKKGGINTKCDKCGKELELRMNNPFENFKYPWFLASGKDYWYCEECGLLFTKE